jgi:2,3,4,5-tetrahydropyridine-2-carboxylate N-succinyltransferase
MNISAEIERLSRLPPDALGPEALTIFEEFKRLLNTGSVRAAEKTDNDNGWQVNAWVKRGILLGFRLGKLTDFSLNEQFCFFDKHTYPLQSLTLEQRVRVVPGGTAIRDGAYVAAGVVIMPPSYINVGAYIDEGTLIDSHALVGSCAQVGRRVHLSAAAQLGGVLEPVGALPVIIEDDVFIGGNSGIYEGTLIKRRAVIGAGVILTASVPVYDLVHQKIYRATRERPLVLPEGAVVVPGARSLSGSLAQAHGLALYAPVIVKYRDEKTDAATVLEEALR